MNRKIKTFIENIIPTQISIIKTAYSESLKGEKASNIRKIRGLIQYWNKTTFIYPLKKLPPFLMEAEQFSRMLSKITIRTDEEYIYPLDPQIYRVLINFPLASLTPDYQKILESSLKDIQIIVEQNTDNLIFTEGIQTTIKAIYTLAERIGKLLNERSKKENNKRNEVLATYFPNLLNQKPVTFDEAIQKILFYNALFWQNHHQLNGIGRLDKILFPYYINDIEKGILTREQAKSKLKKFIQILGRNIRYKSGVLLGDTGQVIILSGRDEKKFNIENELTEIFLDIMSETPVPDPKLILRANQYTSDKIWLKAIKCIITGCGSPLIMNEDKIIPLMESFGYKKEDCWNLGTSACWEPLIIGKSFDQNNCLPNIVLLKPFHETLFSKQDFKDFNSFLEVFEEKLIQYIEAKTCHIDFDKSPLFSLFFDNCITRRKDISEEGTDYSFHGILVVGLPNLINALLNLKTFIFEEMLFTLRQCREAILNNFAGFEDMYNLFQNYPAHFGKNNDDVICFSNRIMQVISSATSRVTINGQKVKVGFSSPAYISEALSFPASLDGRKYGEPFGVHISPVSKEIDIAEVVDFASSLNYTGNRINGNVVDFIVPSIFKAYPEKLIYILKDAVDKGIFELQLNVLNKEQLLEAKLCPEKYPNLIVRVWGFSAYFNDLPEEYKDNLIRRAELYA